MYIVYIINKWQGNEKQILKCNIHVQLSLTPGYIMTSYKHIQGPVPVPTPEISTIPTNANPQFFTVLLLGALSGSVVPIL